MDAIVRNALEAEIKKDARTDILAMAFLGDEAIGDPQWSGDLIYKASTRHVLTLSEDRGLMTRRSDTERYLLGSSGKSVGGFWLG